MWYACGSREDAENADIIGIVDKAGGVRVGKNDGIINEIYGKIT